MLAAQRPLKLRSRLSFKRLFPALWALWQVSRAHLVLAKGMSRAEEPAVRTAIDILLKSAEEFEAATPDSPAPKARRRLLLTRSWLYDKVATTVASLDDASLNVLTDEQ